MKNKIILFIAAMSISVMSIAQNFNGFKYVFIPDLTYQNGGVDIFGISSSLREKFLQIGISALPNDKTQWPLEAKADPCLVLFAYPSNSSGSSVFNPYKVSVTFKNCKNEIVHTIEKDAFNGYRSAEGNITVALKKCLDEIGKTDYSFDKNQTPQIEFPVVESTPETEESIKNYLNSNKLDPIEGIYKSYQSDNMMFYKIGIIKQNDVFKAIIIDSDLKQWKKGEVKAVFEHSSMKGFYSVKWFMGDKNSTETFGLLENEGLLSVELKDIKGDKTQNKFIKMYPSVSNDVSIKKDNSKSSGSGFFITSSGILATNAHVIEDASRIEVSLVNEIGSFVYKAKVLLTDAKNDVALLQIDDEKFKGFTSIPYGFIEKSEVGEKVFTIGYPLSDVMGNNYKVTDGIISSKTGIADDVRYYQISVPLQPGNSGGPLFNKAGNVIGITSAKLNSQAVGTQIENVNYAIKSSYLLNLYNMLPNSANLSSVSTISAKELQDQVKVFKNYICLIRIY